MQVADIQGDATAATLGAKKTTAMGMVQDASFLMMLSTNLYSNQQLACIRETLCNAWDAHIEAGRTDVPVKITITEDNELIIQDSGHGIPEDLFEQNYGTFGGSTKRTNTAVTGGFGLGCKSPWAYTESFRVISENQGKKVIYNLVKASVEADGLPAITRVMETTTERSGLTVRFQLREDDVRQMKHYIEYVALHGDMLVDFENVNAKDAIGGPIGVVRLEQINLDTVPGSYDVDSQKWYAHYMGNHTMFVRYGAVIYPMIQTPGTQKAVDLLKEFMQLVGFQKMVVQAAPGTLALTPNRESLSSSKMTEDGITNLCLALVAKIEEDIIRQIPGSISKAIESLATNSTHMSTLGHRASIHEAILPMPVRRYLGSQLGAAKWAKYERVLREAEQRGFKVTNTFSNKSATREFHRLRRRLDGRHWRDGDKLKRAFAHHYMLRPLSRVFQKHADLLVETELFHRDHYDRVANNRQGLMTYIDLNNDFHHIQALVDAPTVIVTSRTKRLRDSLNCCPDLAAGQDCWVYKIPPLDKRREDIVKAFDEAGFHVVDLTLNHDWDDVAAELEEERLARAAARRRKAGQSEIAVGPKKTPNAMMSLSNVFDAESGRRKMGVERIKLMKSDLETTDTPKFFVPVDSLGVDGSLGRFGSFLDLNDEERKLGVVVRTGTEKNMAIHRGAVHVDNYLAQRLWKQLHSKEYQTYRTKLCREGLFDEHHIDSDHIELIDLLGIKVPGLDKLINDPAMDRVANRAESLDGNAFLHVLPATPIEQMQHFITVVKGYKLEELPCVKKLKAVKDDPFVQCLFNGSSRPLELIKNSPERHAALKSLVVGAFKNGN